MAGEHRLRLPAGLYGREQELARLEEALRGDSSRALLLTGQAGVGKTALVKLLFERHRRKALFLYGKFDPLRRHIPYSAWLSAFTGWARALQGLPAERLAHWRTHLARSLGGHLWVIVDAVPELGRVFAHRPALAPPPAADAGKRFELAFHKLIEALSRPGRPVVIVLDDLQWADAASLQLFSGLLGDPGLRSVLLLGAYRDDELSPVHPLRTLLAEPPERVAALHLFPLDAGPLNAMLADALQRPPAQTKALSDWLHRRSDGNPLFARQLLLALKERGILQAAADGWDWDLSQAGELDFAGDVLELLIEKLQGLPAPLRRLLEDAACLGASVEPALLAAACREEQEALAPILAAAEEAQLLSPNEGGEAWRFLHDRIQQAAYALIPEAERPARHLAIGRRLLAALDEVGRERYLFELVNQFNKALAQLDEPDERLQVARLNLAAGRRAKSAAAFGAALKHLASGATLLPADPWRYQYELTYALAIERAECEYVRGEFAQAKAEFEVIFARARSREDRARAYLLNIALAIQGNDPRLGLRLGASCLALFGIELPVDEADAARAVPAELERVQRLLGAHSPERLVAAPLAADPELRPVAETLIRVFTPAYQCGQNLLVLVTLKLLAVALESREPRACAVAFMKYSLILGSFLGDYERGARFARLALELGAQLEDSDLQAQLLYYDGAMVSHWTEPLTRSTGQLEEARRLAAEAANPLFSVLTASFLSRSLILSGENLDLILQEWERSRPMVEGLDYAAVSLPFQFARQWCLALKGRTSAASSLSDQDWDEEAGRAALYSMEAPAPRHWYWLLKAMLGYYSDELDLAADSIRRAGDYVDWVLGQAAVPEQYFFEALIRCARQGTPAATADDLSVIEDCRDRLQRWAERSPANYAGRAQLLSAELLGLHGRTRAAMDAYDAAVEMAAAHPDLALAALSHELCGRFYLSAGFTAMARAHLTEAHTGYVRWGAVARAERLASALPHLVPGGYTPPQNSGLDPAELAAIGQAARALSAELELPQLLPRLLRLAMKNAGADRALLILMRNKEAYVAAEAAAERQEVEVSTFRPLAGGCALSVVDYVRRTRRPLNLGAAARERGFADDPWIRQQRPHSILCLPILRNGQMLGLMYLESGARENAFSRPRILLLELLIAQLAAALENALLYDDLRRQIRERERAESLARESERRWRGFLDNARLAVVGLDLAGMVEYVNPYLLELTGFQREELLGRNWFDTMLPPRHRRHDLQSRYYQLLREQPYFSVRGALITRSGDERRLAWSNAWLRDARGEKIGTVSLGEDITERLLAERENRRLHRELENRVVARTAELRAANTELEAFAYSVSHDLRAPLRSIDGFSQALLEDYSTVLDAEGRHHLDRVRHNSQRMGLLIDAILQMSRLTRGELHRESVDLSALALELGEELRERHPDHPVQLLVEPGLTARGDPRLLRVVLDNLLGNAWKYSHGVIEPKVSLQRSGSEFCVADNGAGFDMRYADRLFGTFQRLHDEDQFDGSGVGLATVQRIIRRHGGQIRAEGAPGEGARFYFSL